MANHKKQFDQNESSKNCFRIFHNDRELFFWESCPENANKQQKFNDKGNYPIKPSEFRCEYDISDVLDLKGKKNLENVDTQKNGSCTYLDINFPRTLNSPLYIHTQPISRPDIDNIEFTEILSSGEPSQSLEQDVSGPHFKSNTQAPRLAKNKTADSSHDQIEQRPKVSSTKIQKTLKNDLHKNMCGHSCKFILKKFLSKRYESFFNRLCEKYGVTDRSQMRNYYSQRLNWSISLMNVRDFLSFSDHADGDPMKAIKQAFHRFYVWYMRNRYTIHILNEDKIVYKDHYLKKKNQLIYLPESSRKKDPPALAFPKNEQHYS